MSDPMSDYQWELVEQASILDDEATARMKLYPQHTVNTTGTSRIDTIGQNGNEGLHYMDIKHQMLQDQLTKAPHYQVFPGEQALDIIKKSLTPEEYKGGLKFNILKYRLRAGKKDGANSDIEKAKVYEKLLWELE